MDADSIPQQFKRLEQKVEQLVQKCNDLREAKSGLENRVAELEQALRAKDAGEKRYQEEKSLIRSKVDDLVGRLDQVLQSP